MNRITLKNALRRLPVLAVQDVRSRLLVPSLLLMLVVPAMLPGCRVSPFSGAGSRDEVRLSSPSGRVEASIRLDEHGLTLHLTHDARSVIRADLGKFVLDGDTCGKSYLIGSVARTSTDEVWKPVYGEKSTIRNNYHEAVIKLNGKGGAEPALSLICRLYDEGIAFRYLFDSTSAGHTMLYEEGTTFFPGGDYETWVTGTAQGRYLKKRISQIDEACERPLVIRQNDASYLAIGEAACVDFARMKLVRGERENSLQVALDGAVDLELAKYRTPWRYVMVAGSPGALLENNYFILNLNEPNRIDDTSWIKPGKVIREVTLTTQGGMACVDFAAAHHLQYVEFDAGWYGNEYDGSSDATTITVDPRRSPGPLDLHRIIDYAGTRGVGIILYVNRRALEKQLDELLPLYRSWGIKGIKYGFVNVGPQQWTSWLHEAVRKAAAWELMVDVHDEYRPTGYSRTYPNLMTQEGVRGDEESPTTAHTLTTAFTRMIAGAADNTNCFFAPRVPEKMGGKAAQMAKAVMLYSPWQFLYWYDRPAGSPHKKGGAGATAGIIRECAELVFYDVLPTVWDETRVLEAAIGEYATIARRSGRDWYLGSLTAGRDRALAIPLSFLDKNRAYEAVFYLQDEDDLEKNRIHIEKTKLDHTFILSKHLPRNAGLAMIIRPDGTLSGKRGDDQ